MPHNNRVPTVVISSVEVFASIASSVANSVTSSVSSSLTSSMEALREDAKDPAQLLWFLPRRAVISSLEATGRLADDLRTTVLGARDRLLDGDDQEEFESAYDRVTDDTRDLLEPDTDSVLEPDTVIKPDTVTEPVTEPFTPAPEPVISTEVHQAAGPVVAHGDLPLADFDHMTLGQLRGRLRTMSVVELVQLRDYEKAHANRLPITTMLDNRINKVQG
jgi:hypothetical protein